MKYSAVKHAFKPVTGAKLDALVRKHAHVYGRGEQAVTLQEVGLDTTARLVLERTKKQGAPATKRGFSHGR